jgi:hypothetical protein
MIGSPADFHQFTDGEENDEFGHQQRNQHRYRALAFPQDCHERRDAA